MIPSLLETARQEFVRRSERISKRIVVCAGTGCVANGSLKVFAALNQLLAEKNLEVPVELNRHDDAKGVYVAGSGCQGFCQMGPLVNIEPDGIMYVNVRPEDVPEIVAKTVQQGQPVERLLFTDPKSGQKCKGRNDIPFYRKQHRFSLQLCGLINPEDINEYIYHGGYQAAERCYREYTPEQICKTIFDSGLRGRGGGGFPTGKKWDFARHVQNAKKYVICNGDEGDPGAFMDRSVMEGDPHAVIEGMLIAAKAIGADEGYVYVRAEYPSAVRRLREALRLCRERGWIGKNIQDTGFDFELDVFEGAGAFVCGEETAMLESMEGRRGIPRLKPPYPAEQGYRDKPTLINNVETFANIPWILRNGGGAYAAIGSATSKGTKVFALAGKIKRGGLIEVPMGITIREIVEDIGGGTPDGSPFKAVLVGGPSGGCVPADLADTPIDYESLSEVGAIMGSGGLIVLDQNDCMVRMARYFLDFCQCESCGKCTFCRIGTRRMLDILDRLQAGKAKPADLDELTTLSEMVRRASLCGLGKTAPNPVLSALRFFREEFEAHLHGRCPAGKCRDLITYSVKDNCIGCTLCAQHCPVNAIPMTPYQIHSIDTAICTRCNACREVCPEDAILVT